MSNLKYTPPANSEADDSFNYRAYDGSLVGSNERTITISVNAAPVAVNDTDSITAGDADATGNVLTNDTDADDAASALAIRGVRSCSRRINNVRKCKCWQCCIRYVW